MRGIGELKNRGPMGFRSTSVRVEEDWEDSSTYIPPLVYAMAGNRGGALKRMRARPTNL